jgi:adenine-specific DNA-methyltransferase
MFTAERLEQLKNVVPEAIADGKVNWEALKEALGEHLEADDSNAEHFGLFWPGKREARRLAALPSHGALFPTPGEGVNDAKSRNLFIEGNNLEVLKLLQKAYAGQVKMIYIDPPYNTGNDFVYRDDFSEPLGEYLRTTGQADEKGLLTTNTRADGRFHSNWLSMMYPRLSIAREFLSEDGVLFVSIDDNEAHHLRMVLNEIFGEENFLAQITVLTNPKGRVLRGHFARSHDYLLVYARSADLADLTAERTEEEIAKDYPEEDAVGGFRWLELRNTHRQFGRFNRRNLWYPFFVNPTDGSVALEKSAKYSIEVFPLWDDGFEGCWTWGEKKVRAQRTDLHAELIKSRWKVFRKGRVSSKKLQTIWLDKEYSTEKGQATFDDLIPGRVFQSPKPVGLIKKCIELGTEGGNDIVLDFFAGTATTAHAVLALNGEDRGTRQFVCVQLPDPTPEDSAAHREGYSEISAISKERIRRVIVQLKNESRPDEDLGFRVFKLGESHFKAWHDYTGDDPVQLQVLFDEAQDPLVRGWQPEALLTEVMLMEGFPLDASVGRLPVGKDNTVLVVTSDHCAHRLLISLEKQIKDTTVDGLAFKDQDVFVCLESALTDQAKLRLADRCNLKTI